jgi:hypothetical protein
MSIRKRDRSPVDDSSNPDRHINQIPRLRAEAPLIGFKAHYKQSASMIQHEQNISDNYARYDETTPVLAETRAFNSTATGFQPVEDSCQTRAPPTATTGPMIYSTESLIDQLIHVC